MLGEKHGEIIPSYREFSRETYCPSLQAHAPLRAGIAPSMCWGFAQGIGGGKPSQKWPGSAHYPALCSAGTHSLNPSSGNIITKQRCRFRRNTTRSTLQHPAMLCPRRLCQQLSWGAGMAFCSIPQLAQTQAAPHGVHSLHYPINFPCFHHPGYPGVLRSSSSLQLGHPKPYSPSAAGVTATPKLEPHCSMRALARLRKHTSFPISLASFPHFTVESRSLGVTQKKPSLNFTPACQEIFPIPVTNILNIFRGPHLSRHEL